MHKLVRQVRFSVNPFLQEDLIGNNSFASKPCGQGLAIFLDIGVGIVGEAAKETGFVVNVVEIDRIVRETVVPVFAKKIRDEFRAARHIRFEVLADLLKQTKEDLKGKFDKAMVSELSLKLNPFRKISMDCEDVNMIYFSEKFEFAAMHKLWNDQFSTEENFQVFGKCANPSGHGHNYVLEVTVNMPTGEDFKVGEFERTVDSELISLIDHKNLSVDIERFAEVNPTVENIAVYAWERLVEKIENVKLHCVNVWETDKTFCSYYG